MPGTLAEDQLAPLLRKLTTVADLCGLDVEGLRALPARIQRIRAGTVIVQDGQTVSNCCLVVDGYACRHKVTNAGTRQIVSFHIPGDILDLQHLFLERADHNIQAITEATIAFVPMRSLRALVDERPALRRALWRDCLVDASVFREWVLNVGRRDAKTKIAHMLCEFITRHDAMDHDPLDRFLLPMTQEDIADAVGLTAVHVNRMLRALDRDGLIEHRGRTLRVTDWAGLRSLAGFNPGYLHLAA